MRILAVLLLLATPALARPLAPPDLVSLSRIGATAVSPDGRWLVWQQRETDLAADRGRYDLWRLDLMVRAAAPQKIASLPDANETAPAFGRDGQLWFLSDRTGGKSAVYRVAFTGGAAVAVTDPAWDVAGFKLSPRGDALLLWADRPVGAASLAAASPKPGVDTARAYDQLFVRHWDSWKDGRRALLFLVPLAGGKARGAGRPLVGGLIGDVPSKPFGDGSEIAWSPDGRTIWFALREAGRIEPLSTNLDIFAVSTDGSGPPANLTPDNKATDTLPTVSPDGRWLAWGAMKRPGYESDRLILHLRDLRTGQVRALTEGWDRSVETIAWAPDSGSLYVTALEDFDRALFRVDFAGGGIHRLTGPGSVGEVRPLRKGTVVTLDSLTAPADLWRIDEAGRATRLTSVNASRLAGIDMAQAIRFSFAGAGGDRISGFALKPAGLAEGAKAPVALLVHGGPQGSFGNSWSYRWNPAVFAGAGFGAVLIDFHGSIGFGQAFTDSINRDWGGKPLLDLKAGLAAAVERFPWLDGSRACAAGGSYGGYMMNWIEGAWAQRFRCLVNHAGVFDARAMAYETDELWFDEWEHGGPYTDHARDYERWNPVTRVAEWQTPMLVIHGEKDFRIPYTQGLATFTALQRRAIPSRLLIFPDENHWILKPANSLRWHAEVLGWMKRWTAP